MDAFIEVFPVSCCNRIQHELEVSTKQAIFVDSSISDTIRTCIVLGNHRAAMKVKTEFKVCSCIICILFLLIARLYLCSISLCLTKKSFVLAPCIRFLRKDGTGLKFLH